MDAGLFPEPTSRTGMTREKDVLVARLHEALVDEIRLRRPASLGEPFTVAEIYQDLVPYRTHRDALGAAMNGDYEHALLRLLAGEGGYLMLDSEPARRRLEDELSSPNPNTGIFREFAAVDVRLNPMYVDPGSHRATPPSDLTVMPREAPAATLLDLVEADTSAMTDREAEKPMSASIDASPSPDTPEPSPSRSAARPPKGDGPTTCLWCRADLPQRETLRYCPFCGTDVKLVPCRTCGEELQPEWRFCVACGTQVSSED